MIVKFDKNQLRGRLAGTPHGTQFPRPFQDVDARHVALETLKTYLTLLLFTRRGAADADPVEFQIPRANIQTEMPGDNGGDQTAVRFPSVAIVAGEGLHDTYVLGPAEIDESTVDVYGPGTVLLSLAEYVEEFNLEVWADSKPQRRGLVAGMLEAFMPLQESGSLRLKLPDYFDRVATFDYEGLKYVDDPDVVKNRYRAQLRVTMTVPEVARVGYVRLTPILELELVDSQVEAQVGVDG